ncbi:MAG: heme-copper oxidase subunit III [Gemmatimonadaceae bacterium]
MTTPLPTAEQQSLGDVRDLPTVTFGHRSLMWWGTLGFMVIEGWTLALIAAMYFYIRQNFVTWPPLRTPLPSLLVPTINLAVMLVSVIPVYLSDRAARRLDLGALKLWLLISTLVSVAIPVLRWYELWSLNIRWDTNAYGSAAWLLVGTHATLLLLDFADTLGLTLFYWTRRMPIKAMSDTSDNAFYWYFMVGVWIPIYLIVYVGPYVF